MRRRSILNPETDSFAIYEYFKSPKKNNPQLQSQSNEKGGDGVLDLSFSKSWILDHNYSLSYRRDPDPISDVGTLGDENIDLEQSVNHDFEPCSFGELTLTLCVKLGIRVYLHLNLGAEARSMNEIYNCILYFQP